MVVRVVCLGIAAVAGMLVVGTSPGKLFSDEFEPLAVHIYRLGL